ncbi:MAG: tetratricopeptide repeat protein [Flavobacteriales bacterium]|nr:tetratricopeptide repeat protein [Flavobacteriales bacterium]
MRILFLALGFCCSPVTWAQYMAANSDPASAQDTRYKEGERAYRAGDHALAIAAFDDVITSAPEHLNAHLQRGFCHSVLLHHEQAVADFSMVIERRPEHIWAYTCRSAAFMKLGLYDRAILDLERVLQLDPNNDEAFNNRGWAYKAIGEHERACQDWNASRKLGNDEAKIILNNNRCK